MAKVNIEKIAKRLGATRRGSVGARSGHFGAVELVAEVQRRFHVPATGGRPTDSSLTVQRQIALQDDTYNRLVVLADRVSKASGRSIGPLQVGTVLLEHAAELVDEREIAKLLAG